MGQIEAANVVNDPFSGSETPLDRIFNEMSEFVCANGPMLLTRGMPALDANTAILECMKKLKRDRDAAMGIVAPKEG